MVLMSGGVCPRAWPHDIPNQRVDRSTQVTVRPGVLEIDYEVSLTELTLTQDLRTLIGPMPGAERSQWLARYGQVTGPLDAKGFLVRCAGEPLDLSVRGYDLVVEEHPRYTFHFQASLPRRGRLSVHDTNYASSEGTSRLAVRGRDGVRIHGDALPENVEEIAIQPLWQLGDEEERRTRQVQVRFEATGNDDSGSPAAVAAPVVTPLEEDASTPTSVESGQAPVGSSWSSRLPLLLDGATRQSWISLLLVAAGLGALHSLQPGHGKTLVSAVSLQPQAYWYQPALLGLVTTMAHTGSVLVIAAVLWVTGASRVAALHRQLMQIAGFVIAAGGFWRIGRHLGGWEDHHGQDSRVGGPISAMSLVALGLAGGMVPCWDAVGLLVLSAAIGRLAAGVALVVAFGAGMAVVLVGAGLLASRLKSTLLSARSWSWSWEPALGLLSGLILAAIGLLFFLA